MEDIEAVVKDTKVQKEKRKRPEKKVKSEEHETDHQGDESSDKKRKLNKSMLVRLHNENFIHINKFKKLVGISTEPLSLLAKINNGGNEDAHQIIKVNLDFDGLQPVNLYISSSDEKQVIQKLRDMYKRLTTDKNLDISDLT